MNDPECEFPRFNASNKEVAQALLNSKTIAVVGLSPKPERPSHGVTRYMKAQGFRIIPVNPGHKELLGEVCYARLRDVPGPVDIVNIFRRSEAVPDIVEDAIAKKAKVIWMQEGIVNNAAAERAKQAGLVVVMNKCIYKEHAALASA